jgi:hypothetical protein
MSCCCSGHVMLDLWKVKPSGWEAGEAWCWLMLWAGDGYAWAAWRVALEGCGVVEAIFGYMVFVREKKEWNGNSGQIVKIGRNVIKGFAMLSRNGSNPLRLCSKGEERRK